MELIVSLIKEIFAPILNLIGQIGNRKRNKTDRIIFLIEKTNTIDGNMKDFLIKELQRSISLEIKDIEFDEEQTKIIEQEIMNSGYRIDWYHIKTAKKYLYFENKKLKTNFQKMDHILNWSIVFSVALFIVYSTWTFEQFDINGTYELGIIMMGIILITALLTIILSGTSSYFAGQRIKRVVK